MPTAEKPAEPRPRNRKKDYEPPRITSEKIFETQSLITCGKVTPDPGCAAEGYRDS